MSRSPAKMRVQSLLLVGLVVLLGLIFGIRQPRVSRLEAALARYQKQYNQKLRLYLDLEIVLTPSDNTSLADFVEKIEHRYAEMGYTRVGPLRIVVDPVGIQQANQSLSAMVRIPEPGGLLEIGEHLRLALEPMGLGIMIKDGTIVITSQERVRENATAEAID